MDDAKWVQAAVAGDRTAFDKLVVKYQSQAVAVTSRLLGHLQDALDVAQDGFVRAYQSLGDLEQPERFKSWLMRIMVNLALNYRRQRGHMRQISLSEGVQADDSGHGLEDSLPGHEPNAIERIQAVELSGALEQAIEELPESLRTALLLFAVEKLPQKDIADMMGVSLAAVKWNVFEARRRLRHKLEPWL